MNMWIERIKDYDKKNKKGETLVSAEAKSRPYEKDECIKEDDIENKKKTINIVHKKLLHRGYDSVKYELKAI